LERADTAVTKLQISPVIVNGFKNGFHQWIQHIFLVVVEAKFFLSGKIFFQNLDPLYRPVAGKPLALEVLCLEVGTSVASALTAETVFEIMKCRLFLMSICLHAGTWGQNVKISGFSILATPTIEIFQFLDAEHSN